MDTCLEKCEGLSDEAYWICVEQCHKFGEYDALRVKIEYARWLADNTDNW